MSPSLRPATVADLPAVVAIYNHYVLTSTCTFQTVPATPEETLDWFSSHDGAHPVLVAESRGEVIAWGSLSPYHPRQAYARTVEESIYVRHDRHRLGVGRALVAEMLDRGRALGHHTVIATISADQAASIALHKGFGFVEKGRLAELGYKLGRWVDVLHLQKML